MEIGSIMMSFKIDFENFSQQMIPTLTTELIGHFSIDGDSQYHDNLSQLKYYIPPSDPDNVNFDLDKNYVSTRHKSNSHIKLDNILKWISDHFSRLEKSLAEEDCWLGIDFICSRGAIKTILNSPYKERDEWIICASKYHGTIYLCEFYTDEKEHDYVNETMSKKRYNSWGYKFEQYMVADHPAHKPDPSRALNECEEFHCMFKAKFDNHSLLYAAEIDGIFSQQFIKDTLIGKTFEIVELKTMYNKHEDMYGKVYRETVSKWWSQNYLLELNRIICGLRDKNGTVRMIKEYNMHNLPKLSNLPYNVDKCKIFLKIFLNEVKKIVIKDYNKCMYKFHWEPSTKDVINYSEEAPDNEKYDFLKPWFIDKVEQYRKQPQ